MNTIKQHRPAYVTGFKNQVVSFSTTDELLAIPFVAGFRDLAGFHRHSVSRDSSPLMLMAELDGGRKWWVIGYLDQDCPDLPAWKPVR